MSDSNVTNSAVIGRSLHVLKEAMIPFVREFFPGEPVLDVSHMLKLISFRWTELQARVERRASTLSHELIDVRNEWAHQVPFSDEDTFRALDSVERLVRLLGDTDRSETVRKMKEGRRPSSISPRIAPLVVEPEGRQPKLVRVPISATERRIEALGRGATLLRDIRFSTASNTKRSDALTERLNYLTSQVYGVADVKTGKIPRCVTRLDFGWIRESRIEPYKDGKGEFLRVVMHAGDTKEQGLEFFRLNPAGIDWPSQIAGLDLDVRPFIKIADAYASAILWIGPTTEESKRTHTKSFFEQFAGRVLRADWPKFEQQFSNFIVDWKYKCFTRDGFDKVSWDETIVETKRSNFLLSIGTKLSVLIPYPICQDLDNQYNNSALSDKYRDILEGVKSIVEGKLRSGLSKNESL